MRQLDPIEIRRQVWWILRTSERIWEGVAGISKSLKVSQSLHEFRLGTSWHHFECASTYSLAPRGPWNVGHRAHDPPVRPGEIRKDLSTSSNILSNKNKKKEEKTSKIEYHDSISTTEMRKLVEISKKTWKKGTGLLIRSVWGKVTKWWEFSFSSFPLWFGGKLQHSLFALLPQRRSEVLLHGWTFGTPLIASNAPCHMTTFPQLSPPSSSTKAWYIVRAPCGTNLNTAICLRAFSTSFFHGIFLKSSNTP